MQIQQVASPYQTEAAIPTLETAQRRGDRLLSFTFLATVFVVTALVVLAGSLVSFHTVIAALVVLIVVGLIIVWPVVGFYVVGSCAILVEQDQLSTPIVTDRLDIFHWSAGYEGQLERPIGLLLLFTLFVLVIRRLVKREPPLAGGVLIWPFLFYLLCVVAGAVHGLTTGGIFKVIVVELRPIWYFFLSYLLAYNLVTRTRHVRIFLWLVILGAGVKALQGMYIYVVVLHGNLSSHHEIMAHEESFFFAALIVLAILLAAHYRYRPQLIAAWIVLPFVLVAMVANQRRADYIALAIGIVVAGILTAQLKPRARPAILFGMILCAALGVGYVIGFSSSTAPYALPARAIVSVFQPTSDDTSDADSNQYRVMENYDLTYTAKQNPLGLGFGKLYLQPIPLPDIPSAAQLFGVSVLFYVPHNTLFWIWMRLGAVGFFALLYLLGAMIVRGSLIARLLQDRYLQLVAIYIVAVVFMEVLVAIADYQFFWYRNVIYLGLLAGILMKLPILSVGKEDVSR